MTILSVAKQACKFIGVPVPGELVSSTAREHVELLAIIHEMALRLARGHAWRGLAVIDATISGTGAMSYALPADFDRFAADPRVGDEKMRDAETVDRWIDMPANSGLSRIYLIAGGNISFRPALASGETAKIPYQSQNLYRGSGGAVKGVITADDDSFRLDEQLLTLAVIWRWKEQKGQPYAEPMQDFEELKARLVARDSGPSRIAIGTKTLVRGLEPYCPPVVP